MSFILRFVIILIIFAFVVYVFKAIAKLTHHLRGATRDIRNLRDKIEGRRTGGTEMVQCAKCGAFVSSNDALTVSFQNSANSFCSQDCVSSYVARSR